MKAISIRQPWAWLIIHGGKDIENRTWRTKRRGRVQVHASKKIDVAAYNRMAADGVNLPTMADLVTGAVIGSVEIIDCVDDHSSPWFSGPYGLVLKNPKPCRPKPCRGMLSFFEPVFSSPALP